MRRPKVVAFLSEYFFSLCFINLLIACSGFLLIFDPVKSVLAQTEMATLAGRVIDQKGDLVVGAHVEANNLDKDFTAKADTNAEGLYIIPNLRPGRYRISVNKSGFQTIVKTPVEVHIQDVLTEDFILQIGIMTQSVTIEGGEAIVSISPSISTVINRQSVENLPLNGRSFQSLIELAPGVVLTKADSESPGQFSVNGQRTNANYFMVDGVSANIGVSAEISPNQQASGSLPALSALGGTNNLVSVDALQEFRIQTFSLAPEFGRTPGGQISLVTRSGTNEFHGTLFNYFRNDVLDANDWFANEAGLKKPALRQNDFGGVIGGPISKNRTFFFLSYEGLRLRQPQAKTVEVPSIAARQSAPASIKPFLDAFPIPNGQTFPNGFAEFSGSYSDPSSLDAISIRGDHISGGQLMLFGRYNFSPSNARLRRSALNSVTVSDFSTHTLTGGVTLVLAGIISNDLRANWSKSKGASFTENDDFGGAFIPNDSLFFPSFASRRDSFYTLILRGGRQSSLPIGRNADNTQRQINLIDNLSILVGSHQLKFGLDYRRLSPTFDPRKYDQEVTFDGVNGIFANQAAEVFIETQYIAPTMLFTNLSVFAQDIWRIAPRLTLTYGIRWEYNPPPKEKNGNDPFTVNQVDDPVSIALQPRGTSLWKKSYDNFAPRFGIAYRISTRSGWENIIRSGAGIFYDLGNGLAANAAGFGIFPFSRIKFLSDVSYPLTTSLAAPPPFSLDPPYGFLFVYQPDLKTPVSYQYNFASEQALGSKQSISVSYVAAIGRRLLRQELLIQPNPNFDFIFVTRNAATSDYHALQLQFQRRLSRGLQALASYTWSHSTDNISNESSFFNVPTLLADVNRERGPSDFDVRHTFTAAVSYDIPSPKGNVLAKAAFRNWSVDSLVRVRSATPLNIVTGTNFLYGFFAVRPDIQPGVPLYLDDPSAPGGRKINRAAFTPPPDGQQGNLGRNALRGFSFSQIDLSGRRKFSLREQFNLQFRADIFNLFNHPNFADPVNDLSSGLFGKSTQMLGKSLGSGSFAGGFNPLYQIGGSRSIQLALRLQF